MKSGLRCLSVLLISTLAACSLPGARTQAISYYVLEAPAAAAVSAAVSPPPGVRPMLLLRDAEPGGLSQSMRLVYSRAAGTRALYQYANWVESPSKRLQTMLRERLLASGRYAGVAQLGAGIQGDFQLNHRLLDFFHNAQSTPGVAHVKLDVELIERGSARLLAQRVFVAEVPLARQDAAAAADGLGQASGQVLDALVAWLAGMQPFAVGAAQAR